MRAIKDLQGAEFWVYGADMEGSAVETVDLKGRVAVVLGREGEGLHELVRKTCDGLITIPTTGHIESLNVSVAAGVILYEIRRQRNSGLTP